MESQKVEKIQITRNISIFFAEKQEIFLLDWERDLFWFTFWLHELCSAVTILQFIVQLDRIMKMSQTKQVTKNLYLKIYLQGTST
jgi:hypothetical protein